MSAALTALGRAFADLFDLRVLWIVIWPLLAAGALWLVLGIVFWTTFSGWIDAALAWVGLADWLANDAPGWFADVVQALLHLLFFVPLVALTALVITALFAMPALVARVAERRYPQLERRSGGSLAGSLVNAVVALAGFVLFWIVSLPLWLVGVGVIVPFIAAAWLNQRLFRYDAIGEHADAQEMRALFDTHRNGWWGLGFAIGLAQFVPVLNLLAPVYAALAFIHYGLARLETQRQAASSARVLP